LPVVLSLGMGVNFLGKVHIWLVDFLVFANVKYALLILHRISIPVKAP